MTNMATVMKDKVNTQAQKEQAGENNKDTKINVELHINGR
jgi:hypothetical protein